VKPLRCAVYTRKSTEDGLEQEFNSLDAQREACEAYVLSQRHEGWTLVPGRFDDGGFSGGNMERPGLKALLASIEAGEIDVIVVYKVDRLTRSLADFAKIVERLDAKQASFVSVTQAFNTTTSMGRLTLNVLLSFAQFEREVTGERIRDKLAASKKKGIWMGGPVPLGYQVVDRKLVPIAEEAERVRTIMRRYIECGSAPELIARLEREGVLTKIQQRTSGPHRGGIPFRRGSLFYLLHNPTYRGMIVHHGKAFEGEHQAIVDEELWNAVQAKLAEKAPRRRWPKNDSHNAILRGLLSDPEGRPMVPTYGSKGSRQYWYYETRKDLARPADPPSTRFRRGALEDHLFDHLGRLLADEHALRGLAKLDEAEQLRALFADAGVLGARISHRWECGIAIRELIVQIRVNKDHLEVTLEPKALGLDNQSRLSWIVPRPARKPYREAKVRIDANRTGTASDPQLVKLLADAFEVQKLVLAAPDLSLNQLASKVGRCRKAMAKLLRLSWLSPSLVESILDGSQPKSVSRARLLDTELPLDWAKQELMFRFAA
jgi:site-specific DNA recombinase